LIWADSIGRATAESIGGHAFKSPGSAAPVARFFGRLEDAGEQGEFGSVFGAGEPFGEIRIAPCGIVNGFRVAVDIARGSTATATDGEESENGVSFQFVESLGAAGSGHDGGSLG